MKTFFAVMAAGLLGGGLALGAVALELVPVGASEASERVKPLAQTESDETRDDGVADSEQLKEQIKQLQNQLDALNVRLESTPSPDKTAVTPGELDALKAEIASLKSGGTVVAKPAGDADEEASVDVPEDFEAGVREVMDRIAEERAEERRLNQQAQRLEQLEEAKQRIADFVPTFVENQAEQLGIAETVVTDVSNALVTHLTYRTEIMSERQGQRIDGVEVDEEAYQQKLEDLNQTSIAALSTYVDADTAEKLVNASSRLGRGRGNDNGRNNRRGNR